MPRRHLSARFFKLETDTPAKTMGVSENYPAGNGFCLTYCPPLNLITALR